MLASWRQVTGRAAQASTPTTHKENCRSASSSSRSSAAATGAGREKPGKGRGKAKAAVAAAAEGEEEEGEEGGGNGGGPIIKELVRPLEAALLLLSVVSVPKLPAELIAEEMVEATLQVHVT